MLRRLDMDDGEELQQVPSLTPTFQDYSTRDVSQFSTAGGPLIGSYCMKLEGENCISSNAVLSYPRVDAPEDTSPRLSALQLLLTRDVKYKYLMVARF